MGRLLTHTQEIDGQAEELIAENVYDELGQLAQKKVENSSTNPLQEIDYRYNVRGWLKAINDVDIPGDDLFNFQINYNSSRSGVVDPLYNGNIAETYWKTGNDNTLRRYAYTYDALNRITSGLFNGSGQTDRYTVAGMTYDKNGNIEALTRRGHLNSGATSFGIMDNLSYTYNAGNKLLKVDDNGNTNYGFKDGSNTGNDYTYDPNGNVLTDANKGITGTTYNHLNLPTQINFGSDKIMYIYDASGVKLKKEATEGSSVTETEYAGNYIYENGQLKQVSHPEGYFEPKAGGGYQYVYRFTDIWGNTRVTYADDNGDGVVGVSEIRREQNYYPFGLKHKGYNHGTSSLGNSVAQRWKYNGKEYDESLDINTYDFGARNYDPALMRWMNIDPRAEQMRRHSPYNYAFNNPIYWIDPDGMAPNDIWKLEQSGKLVWVAADDTKDVIYSTNANGNITLESNMLVLEKGSIEDEFSTDKAMGGIVVKDQETAKKVFKFTADNLDGKNGNEVEMATVTAANDFGEEKSVVIGGGGNENVDTVGAANKLKEEGYTSLKETEHSHPGDYQYGEFPSGYASDGKRYPNTDEYYKSGDGASVEYMNANSKTRATHKMYHPKTKTTYVFDEKEYRKID